MRDSSSSARLHWTILNGTFSARQIECKQSSADVELFLDFVALCEELDIVIERSVTLDRKGRPYRLNPRGGLANLPAEQALFLLRRARR